MPVRNKTRESVAQNSWLIARLDFLVAGDRDFDFGGFKMIINPWWLNRGGKIIGGWVEVDWWLQNFCSMKTVFDLFLEI